MFSIIRQPNKNKSSFHRYRAGRPPFLLIFETALSLLFLVTSSAFVAILPHAFADGGMVDANTKSSKIMACSSNFTHCGWIDDGGNSVSIMTMDEARSELFNYLSDNRMPYDVPIAKTLGYISDVGNVREIELGEGQNIQPISRILNEGQHAAVDGLSDGIVNQTIFYSLQVKAIYPWTDNIPKSIYMEYVVPYAVVNEPRTDHRPLLFHALRDTLKDYERRPNDDSNGDSTVHIEQISSQPQEQIKAAVKLINTRLWSILGRGSNSNNIKAIAFQAGLTPRIYDPLSVIAYGHSSCTGLAILFIAALRSVGIPSRLAGTPAWNDYPEEGNHSWVEVYIPGKKAAGVDGEWIFLEPTPGIAEGEENTSNADDLDRDACDRWFCNAEHFDGKTRVFATGYTKQEDDVTMKTHFPMAWSDVEEDTGVPGEDRSEYYTSICGQCLH